MYTLTDEQLNIIIESIEGMLDQVRIPAQRIDAICDPDYLKGRSKYPMSAVVYTGFDVENQNIPDLIIQKIQYGRGRFMPELYNRDVVFQLYSDSADFCGTKELLNKIDAFGERLEVIQFHINRDTYLLEKLEQITFDGFNGNAEKRRARIAERRVLFESNG